MKWFLCLCVMFSVLAVPPLPCYSASQSPKEVSEESAAWERFWALQVVYNLGASDEEALLNLGEAARKVKYFQFAIKVLQELLDSYPDNVQGRMALAKAYLGSGEAAKAYSLLHADLEAGKDGIETYLLLGLSAEGIGNLNEAIEHLTTYLGVAEPNPLARLKLATVFYRAERYGEARKQALLVRSMVASTEIHDNAEALLRKLERERLSRWHLQLAGGYLYDSNATLGPKQEDAFYSYLDYSGAADEKAEDDQALVLQGVFRHTLIKPSGWSWMTLSGISRIDYAREHSRDYLNLSLASGPRYTRRSVDFTLPVVVQGTRYGESGGLTILRYGLAPKVVHHLSKRWQIQGTLNLQRKIDNDDTESSSRILIVSPAIGFKENRFALFVGGQVGRETAKADLYSYNLASIKSSVSKEWFKGLHTSIWGGFFWRKYDEQEPGYDEKRQDRTERIGFSTLIDLAGPRCQLNLTLNHLENHSNIPSHRFDQHQFYTTVRVTF